MTLIAELINHFENGTVKMAKVKKAQLGDHLVKRQSQDDRIHRIEKKDPERAERVAARVQKRALRSVKPSSVKPPSRMSMSLRERAKAAKEKKAAEALKAPKAKFGKGIKKAQWGSTEGGRCGISRAAAKDARKSEREYAKQSRQAEREQKRESKAAAKQAKRTPSMRKGGNISKNK
jgi:hypothetical protein